MFKYSVTCMMLVTLFGALVGCGVSEPTAGEETAVPVETEAPAEVAETTVDPYSENGDETNLNQIALDSYTVKALHIGDVTVGHFNLFVEGGEPSAVRAWVGDEGATDVMVTKAEFEVDHHCAHVEVPTPLPADAKLWVELETPDGKRLKGSATIQ